MKKSGAKKLCLIWSRELGAPLAQINKSLFGSFFSEKELLLSSSVAGQFQDGKKTQAHTGDEADADGNAGFAGCRLLLHRGMMGYTVHFFLPNSLNFILVFGLYSAKIPWRQRDFLGIAGTMAVLKWGATGNGVS